MKKKHLLFLVPLFCFNLIIAQKNAVTIKLMPGIGFADTTSFIATEFSIGYEFKKNRIEFTTQGGSKKRKEYINGDLADLMMSNYTLNYSRLISKNKFKMAPKLGVGYVSGRWENTEDSNNFFDPNYGGRSKLLTGFGLNYGLGIEYNLIKFLSLSINYNEALLLSDLSGNKAILGGLIFKISKKDK